MRPRLNDTTEEIINQLDQTFHEMDEKDRPEILEKRVQGRGEGQTTFTINSLIQIAASTRIARNKQIMRW